MVKVGDLLYWDGAPWWLQAGGVHVVLSVEPDTRRKRNSVRYDEVQTMAPDGRVGRFWLDHEFTDGEPGSWRRVDL